MTQPSIEPTSDEPGALDPRPVEEELQFVNFDLAGEEYLVSVDMVREIIKKITITSIPKSSPYLEGIIDLRGSVIPIINLRKKLGHPPVSGELEQNIIIVEAASKLIGLVVDGVREVIRTSAKKIESNPSIHKSAENYLTGVLQRQDRLLIVLDIGALFKESDMWEIANST